MKIVKCILILICFYGRATGQDNFNLNGPDTLLKKMTLEEKIGQLFIIRSFSNENEEQTRDVIHTIKTFGVGGVCFFKGTLAGMTQKIDTYQTVSKWPLLMSMDGEWGLGMRLTDVSRFPKQMCLGALTDNKPIYRMAYEMASQMKLVGLHMNFAPVADINNNLLNPVINERSFGSDRRMVTAKVFAYMQGLQDGGILACLKHFPGHGDTEVDSHKDLPVLPFSKSRLDSLELFPFAVLSKFQPAAMMVGHLHIPRLDSTPNMSATLSEKINHQILREEFGYEGLIITDALEMEGVTKHFSDAEIALFAFKAGNDMLLLSRNIFEAGNAIKDAIQRGEISERQLDEKVSRILNYKHKVGLFAQRIPDRPEGLLKSFNKRIATHNDQLYRKAMCLGRDPQNLIPIRDIPAKIITLKLGKPTAATFLSRINDYAAVSNYSLEDTSQWNDQLGKAISEAELIIIHVHGLSFNSQKSFGLDLLNLQKLNPHLREKKCIVVMFGCPYVAMYFPQHCSLFLAHEENELSMDIAAQMLFGTDPIVGTVPMMVSNALQQGKSITRPSLLRMGYSIPETQGMSSDSLEIIDSIVYELISQKAAPGCQVAVARNNKIIYQKSFGYLDYDSLRRVENNTIYDLASLTKIVTTAPILFQLEDRNKIKASDKFSDYFELFRNTNKEQLTFKDFMMHQGRLLSWIPYYRSTLVPVDSPGLYNPLYYDTIPSKQYNIPVCEGMFLRSDFVDTILQVIADSRLLEERKFNYSDLGFYFIPKLVQQVTGKNFERYFQKEISEKLELRNVLFNPIRKGIPIESIAPTEMDPYWRKQRIQGYVHDMGAAMMGGISGHAGLFGNAHDVLRLMQLYLNRGQYAGREILKASSIGKKMTRDWEFQRRAYLFDMPQLKSDSIKPYVSSLASNRTIGHQGFTGTCAWADPDAQINYVFLSNRTFPLAENNKLHKERYRTRIQEILYKAIIPDAGENPYFRNVSSGSGAGP